MLKRNNLRILVVDDEPDILDLLEEEFRDNGYQTARAACGQEAIKVLETQEIDVVVSDYKMPNGNGMSVLTYVNSMKVPPLFFFVSGQADVSIEEALKAGARKFFSKPFNIDELIKEIEINILDSKKI